MNPFFEVFRSTLASIKMIKTLMPDMMGRSVIIINKGSAGRSYPTCCYCTAAGLLAGPAPADAGSSSGSAPAIKPLLAAIPLAKSSAGASATAQNPSPQPQQSLKRKRRSNNGGDEEDVGERPVNKIKKA